MKAELRKRAKNILLSLDEDTIEKLDNSLSANLFEQLNQHSNVKTLGVFSPLKREPKWYQADEWPSNYKFSLPHIINEEEMKFYIVSFEEISTGNIGLELDEECLTDEVVPDALVIPGLAFTKNLERLGRGKGYFDRYLSCFKGLKIGVCFESQIFESIVTDKHDIRMDLLITDKNIYKKG